MSKGNMLLGNARGSVGDVTFQVLGGQQIAKKKSTQPKNPRTVSQMMQRAVFASAVQFFSRGQQNFFQFAFENKDAKLSDYNAFMSINAKMGVPMSPEMLANPACPAIGKFQMTKGSLSGKDFIFANPSVSIEFEGEALDEEYEFVTVGDVSKYILDSSDYMVGDILTFVRITSAATPGTTSNPIVLEDGAEAPKWDVTQLIINPNDTTKLEDIHVEAWNGGSSCRIGWTSESKSMARGYVYVHSRKTTSGLKVSTSSITLNEAAASIVELANSIDWKEKACPALWKAAPEAILQGAIANR